MLDAKADYYGLLGLDRKANPEQIRAAFRNLAKEFHPDRNPDPKAQAIFRQISEAYDVLSDPENRKIYDKSGSDGLRGRTVPDHRATDYASVWRGYFGYDPTDPNYFGKDSPFGDGSAVGKGGQGWNLRAEIEIEQMEAIGGCRKTVQIIREETCSKCKGSRSKPGSWPATCSRCEGKGSVYSGPGLFQQVVRCPDCTGAGKRIVVACDQCRGAGTIRATRKIEVSVPPRVRDGDWIRMSGQGDASQWGGPPGNLTIDLRVRKGART